MKDLIELYPSFLSSKIFTKIIEAEQTQIEREELDIKNLEKEFFIDSAVVSLPLWAEFAGIEDNMLLDLDIRRSNIKAALKSMQTTTPLVVKNIAESYSNGNCEVVENYSDYSFIVKFISTIGVPSRIDEIKKIIDKVKPAHLNYDFKFRYITWGDTKKDNLPASWYKEKGYTWEDVKNGIHLKGVE